MTTTETKEKALANEMQVKEFNYSNTDDVLEDVCSIIDSAREYAYKAVNITLIKRNWLSYC